LAVRFRVESLKLRTRLDGNLHRLAVAQHDVTNARTLYSPQKTIMISTKASCSLHFEFRHNPLKVCSTRRRGLSMCTTSTRGSRT
jgi:hypothetical protein